MMEGEQERKLIGAGARAMSRSCGSQGLGFHLNGRTEGNREKCQTMGSGSCVFIGKKHVTSQDGKRRAENGAVTNDVDRHITEGHCELLTV